MKKVVDKKKITISFIIVLCIVSLLSCGLLCNVAKAYDLNAFYFVDTNKHLDWDGTTKYDWSGAVDVWNSHRAIIRPDAWNTYEDVVVSDYSDPNSYFAVITFPNQPKEGRQNGTIKFNTAHVDTMSIEEQKSLVVIQLGYALGLLDNKTDSTSVMGGGNNFALSDDDIAGLNYLYNFVY